MQDAPKPTLVTPQQALIHAMYVEHRSMSVVARALGLTMIRVREALVQHERNLLRDQGIRPPPLREMLKGDVTTRFDVSRSEAGGRPSKHRQHDFHKRASPAATAAKAARLKRLAAPTAGTRRLVVTCIEPDAPVHLEFWRNLKAYASHHGAELVVGQIGSTSPKVDHYGDHAAHLAWEPFGLGRALDVAFDERLPARLPRPLDAIRHRSSAGWTLVGHPAIQFETLPRVRADGYKAQMTTGVMTVPRNRPPHWRRELGAVVVEITQAGSTHCRHILAPLDGDGSFQDLDLRVSRGYVRSGCAVEALTFGDVHHAQLDPVVAAATWGLGAEATAGISLVDRLRPRHMVFHDVCDFESRSAHDRGDHLRRFAQMVAGGGDVAAELTATARFLEATRRKWSQSVVVGSNHDEAFVRWLREADFREDPLNAVFFLESALDLHRRLAAGEHADNYFEHTLRRLAPNGLSGVRFLRTGESLKIGGIEAAINGHAGADGRQGDIRFFERLGIRATLGHTHKPISRDGIYCSGVCQEKFDYSRGVLTGWGIGHVVTYFNGSRQHLIFIDGAFHA